MLAEVPTERNHLTSQNCRKCRTVRVRGATVADVFIYLSLMSERKPKIKPREQVESERAARDDYLRQHAIAMLKHLRELFPQEFERIAGEKRARNGV